jgi:cytochrome P450
MAETKLDLHEKKAEILAMMVDTKTGVPLCGDQKDVFLANAAVSWLMEHTTAKTRDDAVEFCRDLANRRVIESVDKGKDFTDSDDKFRFVSTTMEDDTTKTSSIPGTFGVPLVGETLKLQKNPTHYFCTHAEKYGGIFKSNLVFEKTVCFANAEAMKLFYNEEFVQRSGGMPPHWQVLFSKGTNNVVNMLDGDIHKLRKSLLMNVFTDEAMESYLEPLRSTLRTHITAWMQAADLTQQWTELLKSLCFDVCTFVFLGLSDFDTKSKQKKLLTKKFYTLVKGFAALPINAPGTAYSKAIKARDELLEMMDPIVRNHQQHRIEYSDGLSRLFDAIEHEDKKQNLTAPDTCLPRDVIKLELLHFLIAANAPLCTLAVYLAYEMTRNGGKLRDQLFEEVREVTKNFTERITLSLLRLLSRTEQTIFEVKRRYGGYAVPLGWGRVKKDIVARTEKSQGSFVIPKGWRVCAAFVSVSLDPTLYPEPLRFEPERFSPSRAEHKRAEFAFVPQGHMNPHISHGCAGVEFSTIVLKLFVVELARANSGKLENASDAALDWTFLPQNFDPDESVIPSLPKDGLLVRFCKKNANTSSK